VKEKKGRKEGSMRVVSFFG
jgi:hypothetical protein